MDPSLAFMDDLLDFNSDIGEGGEDEEDEEGTRKSLPKVHNPNGSPDPTESNLFNSETTFSAPATVEEELEWISNKDAFPSVYTFVDTLMVQSDDIAELSTPVSVLENTSTSSNNNNNKNNSSSVTFFRYPDDFKVPSKARSKFLQKRRQEISSQPLWMNKPTMKYPRVATEEKVNGVGRKCQHCGAEKTPQWRAGPLGPKTLCNACGVRFKSGRLVPEYRPASSPTFSNELHSNSHRKVMEMRRKKEKVNSVNSLDKG